MAGIWKWFLAKFHLSDAAVCELSAGRGPWEDYHDYPDDIIGTPSHFVELTCKRCGKKMVDVGSGDLVLVGRD